MLAYYDLGPGKHVIVHGACPTGADKMADDFAKYHDLSIDPHPADWNRLGRAAGPLRNAEMVALGADICLAFIGNCSSPRCHRPEPHPSHGATHCANLAERAGIPVRRFLA